MNKRLKECNYFGYICLEKINKYHRDIVFKRVLISLFFILSWCQESIAKKAQGGRGGNTAGENWYVQVN